MKATNEGTYTSILNGLLTGFLYPLLPFFFLHEPPLPNFFDADAEAAGQLEGGSSHQLLQQLNAGSEPVSAVVFGKSMQVCRPASRVDCFG